MKALNYFDATTIVQAPNKPVGISRIEFEACRYIIENNLDYKFCQFDYNSSCYISVRKNEIEDKINNFGRPQGEVKSPPQKKKDVIRIVLRRIAPPIFFDFFNVLKKQAMHFFARKIEPHPDVIKFNRGDNFVWFGISWESKRLNLIKEMHATEGVDFYYYCHDIIPCIFPNFVGAQSRLFFMEYLATLCETSNGIIFNSECSRSDFFAYSKSIGMNKLKSCVVNPANNDLSIFSKENLSDIVLSLANEKYIIYVSTIEKRKNHEVLYKAYLHMLSNAFDNIPKLVIVGSYGWLVENLIYDFEFDERIKPAVVVLSNVNDDELAFLYKNCLFTVYPSFYEGWGMPISESLSAGKFCLTSGQGAIVEDRKSTRLNSSH